jgi:fructose-1,6-bisphosphatase/inositol monophosphatase family enzyme
MPPELDLALNIADDVGRLMRRGFGIRHRQHLKHDNTIVTDLDLRINDFVIDQIHRRYPQHQVLGEERKSVVTNADLTWICDPIDGTLPFVLGIPTSMFSLALVDRAGRPLVAVLHDPFLKRSLWASLGRGTFLNGERLNVNRVQVLSSAIIGLSGGSSNVIDTTTYRASIINAAYRTMILNSISYESALVAEGRIAAAVFPGEGAHDIAAVKLIVEEAGGLVTDLRGSDQPYLDRIRGAVISNGHIHHELLAIVRKSLLASRQSSIK